MSIHLHPKFKNMQTKISKTIVFTKFNGEIHQPVYSITYNVDFYPSGMVVRDFSKPSIFYFKLNSAVIDESMASSQFINQLIDDDIHSTDWNAEHKSKMMADGLIHTPDPGDKIIPADHDDHDANRDRDDDRFMEQLNDHFNTENL